MSALVPPTTEQPAATPPDVLAAAANAAAASFAALEARLDYLNPDDRELVRRAYRFADQAHLGQWRKNGEPYITHPIAVAAQCAEWKLDAPALMAALLHDAMEDCGVTKLDLVEQFGASVAELVDGLTKLDKLQFTTREENQAESFRKMLLAMARDVRVILIKLADRTHNMRTMGDMPRSKWARISTETLEIYAPIAHRLGLNQTYRELQDLAFRHLQPWRYSVLAKAVGKARHRRRDLIQKVQNEVESSLADAGLSARVIGREKTLYSIYRKMDDKHLSFAQVNDLYGVRVIVPNVVSCYTAMGLLHQLYKPVPGRFKDYIAMPKVNGYQSLHTTLVGPASVNIEFQIRTEQMDLVAEAGVAAHWLYKQGENASGHEEDELDSRWLQSLLDIQHETRDATEFWDHIKVDLAPDAVYVFTPKGQIMALPQGATTVDYAYAIHSNIGDHTVAAKVNGEQVPLRTELSNGDVIEIITAPVSSPNPAWLGFVRTGRARSKIRHYLKTLAQNESVSLGEKLLAQALRSEGMDRLPADNEEAHATWDKLLRFTGNRSREELMTDIGLGKRVASIVAKRLSSLLVAEGVKPDALMLTRERFTEHEKLSQGAVVLDGSENASIKFATCCRPIPGDRVVGYLGRGEGLVVHTEDCGVARRLQQKDAERFITVEWADEPVRTFPVAIAVTVVNGKGVLARVASSLAAAEADIVHMGMAEESAQDATELRFVITVRDRTHLDNVLRHVRRTPSVLRVARTQ
ncbi:bifunctional (p)ppGpp synthetase/guanosine-3',5'-bis(diphosphate) 3'-pyrophosphohydrolase [Ottowia sp.]|uniref:RelA/SpoT family protein n=1 Tax=Ottowia sp. TaxID=1898956 RepID=UPI001DF49D7F|nr:bifunctional (p)ppGpp synthetase/guanosine-3',5'-bis(diphosphate) 3'-pyrophosphohydrolase [Ottowia sp.]MCB2024942.1 bifunctional (p)ppGpp synthetase/guanosine-3',5'-bis(diphosphate) 3'-pyrophosphohydrolase [Ottowia sp.]MCP5257688.1 bifunctional (p)ppGpp synthetase/guanosine-3',5'-bis(diphosphate) 3'-pyrophosphohydrolase [Burkholderiaceae bacterium]HRW73908.1 bifunctional (p)ppGpp synthetase/guanosine-3',5'-bis(diphosphate) 3'-pyrophosphohydrolase [Ottowia sp.]